MILTAGLGYTAEIWFPWWSVAIVAFAVQLLLPQKPFAAFVTAFLAVFLLWGGLAFFKDLGNDHILSARMAALILQRPSWAAMIAVSALPAALPAGLAALSAAFLRSRRRLSSSRTVSFGTYYKRHV